MLSDPRKDTTSAPERPAWGTRLGFVLAAAGSAVGLGNIWKFPYVTGENGGGIFVLLYLGAVFMIGLPIMLAEILIGRKGQGSPVTAFLNIRGKGSRWSLLGWLGVAVGFIILSYYAVVAGWVVYYLFLALTGSFHQVEPTGIPALFDTLYESPLLNVALLLVFMGATTGVVVGGVKKGIERWNLILMPALFILLLLLVGYACTMSGFGPAMKFLFTPEFSRFKGSASVLEAVGQAFFSLSLGMGALLTYGSYLRKDADLVKCTAQICLLDIMVAMLAGCLLFPVIFSFGFEPEAGVGLVFKTLPVVFAQLPAGIFLAPLFFLLLLVAALTSAVSLLEVVSVTLMERLSWPRARAVVTAGGTITAFGLLSALSGSSLSEITLLKGMNLFDSFDYLASNWLLPLGGIGMAVFAGWVLTGREARQEFETGSRFGVLFPAWKSIIAFLCPVALTLVFLNAVGVF